MVKMILANMLIILLRMKNDYEWNVGVAMNKDIKTDDDKEMDEEGKPIRMIQRGWNRTNVLMMKMEEQMTTTT